MKKVLMMLAIFLFLWSTNRIEVVRGVEPSVTFAEEVSPSLDKIDVDTELDLTSTAKQGDRLTMLLDSQTVNGWWGINPLKHTIRMAVSKGVSPNTLVLLFLFPLVAALVAFSRQVVGVSGFGIITPALLSVAFLSTGGVAGLVLLIFILCAATLGKVAIKKVKIPYLPKLAVLIWLISMAVLGLLLVSPVVGLERLISVGIFPIMLFVLLAETFIEAQITRSFSTSIWMTMETVVLALIAYKIMSAPWIQSQVLLNPEVSVIVILCIDLLIGRYKGLRLSEVWRFRKLLNK